MNNLDDFKKRMDILIQKAIDKNLIDGVMYCASYEKGLHYISYGNITFDLDISSVREMGCKLIHDLEQSIIDNEFRAKQ